VALVNEKVCPGSVGVAARGAFSRTQCSGEINSTDCELASTGLDKVSNAGKHSRAGAGDS